jgi:hypothetical protein
MAASLASLVPALLSVARFQGNPQAWLQGIIDRNFSSAVQGNGTVLISTATGGSSGAFTLPAGMDPFSVIQIAQMALDVLGTGIDVPVTYDANGIPISVPYIQQLPNSQRTTSYAQFGNIRH